MAHEKDLFVRDDGRFSVLPYVANGAGKWYRCFSAA